MRSVLTFSFQDFLKLADPIKFLTEILRMGEFGYCQIKRGRAVAFQKPQGRSLYLSET